MPDLICYKHGHWLSRVNLQSGPALTVQWPTSWAPTSLFLGWDGLISTSVLTSRQGNYECWSLLLGDDPSVVGLGPLVAFPYSRSIASTTPPRRSKFESMPLEKAWFGFGLSVTPWQVATISRVFLCLGRHSYCLFTGIYNIEKHFIPSRVCHADKFALPQQCSSQRVLGEVIDRSNE